MRIFEAIERGLARPRNSSERAGSSAGAPPERQLAQVLEAASWAPSAYNTQPWRFQVLRSPDHRKEAAEALSIPWDPAARTAWVLCHLDRSRMLPVADPLGTETYIALGMACLNVQAASAASGLGCRVWGPFGPAHAARRPRRFSPPGHLEPYFLFEIGEGGAPDSIREPVPAVYRLDSFRSDPLRVPPPPAPPDRSGGPEALACIRARRTDRVPFLRGDSWPEDRTRALSAARGALEAHETGEVELLLVEDPGKTMELTRLQERAWRRATGDRGRFRETCGWMRFTRREWKRRKDGEFVGHFGLSGWRKAVARLGLKTPLAPLAMALGADRFFLRRAEVSTETTGAFLATVLEDPGRRFESDELHRRKILTGVGAALQSLWLTLTALGASLQFQTSIIVQQAPRAELRRTLEVPDTHDLLSLVRIGRPQRDPHYAQIRRDPGDVVTRTG